MNRRDFLGGGVGLSAAWSVGLSGCVGAPDRRRSGAAATESRLIVVFLRGAVDGLSVVVPHGERDYYAMRPTIAIAPPGKPNGAIDLDRSFGMHPALQKLLPLWEQKKLAFVLASGSPDPSRSHFDAQEFMETGTPGRKTTVDGWLNRLLGPLPGERAITQAVSVGDTTPRILSGATPVATLPVGRDAGKAIALDQPQWRQAFDKLYAGRDTLSVAYRTGVAAHQELVADLTAQDANAGMGAPAAAGFALDAAHLAWVMRRDARIRIGFIALGGWDTHAAQGGASGQLANRLRGLSDGLATLAVELGPAFKDTVVAVVSEFGRTCRENGNGGTDHGHGNAIWLLGGAVRGGMLYGEWPGLSSKDLYEGRDLAVTTDFRSVFAHLCTHHLGVADAAMGGIFSGFAAPPSNRLHFLAA
jgi:uncharacterized protein (DUF1501 family)